MRTPWSSRKEAPPVTPPPTTAAGEQRSFFDIEAALSGGGEPLMVPIDHLDADPHNPRTDLPQHELDELAQDITLRGVLQPIVVTPSGDGRYIVRLGSKRWRAAQQAGLKQIPATVAIRPIDGYAQVAENLKRHGLSPMDMARFMQARVQAGESNATIAKQLDIDQTTVAHHLALLSLPEVLGSALKSGRCTSPRTLYELSKLHDEHLERVNCLIDSDADITRSAVAAIRAVEEPAVASSESPAATVESVGTIEPDNAKPVHVEASPSPFKQASHLADRLDSTVTRLLKSPPGGAADASLAALGDRLRQIATRLPSA